MLFNSLHFFLFFPIVVILYFIIPHKYRWTLLLIASYYFYMSWNPGYVLLLAGTTLMNYRLVLQMDKVSKNKQKKYYLIIALIANLVILFTFKYYNFFSSSLQNLLSLFGSPLTLPYSKLLLPVGISFYTFQTMSYVIDVYKGKRNAETHLGIFAVYVSFFPQLVAGPIERSTRLMPQFFEKKNFDYERVTDGLKLIMWGMFKKVVIADRLALLVGTVYENVNDFGGYQLVLATIFFSFQIYCDFSAYSDIAIGAAQIMGYDLMDNFKRPYFAKNIVEFWHRWHISLSTWFRDYVYIPLGGNRVGKIRAGINVMIVFLVSGLWHGANWTFVVWGALHGFYIIFSRWTKKVRSFINQKLGLTKLPTLQKYIQVIFTFLLVSFTWIFFRANSLNSAIKIIEKIVIDFKLTIYGLLKGNIQQIFDLMVSPNIGLTKSGLIIAYVSILILLTVHLIQRHSGIRHMLRGRPAWQRWSLYYLLLISIALFGVFDEVPFIYFQF